MSVERIGGNSRYHTAALIAEEIPHEEVVIASGMNFPDALAVAPYASMTGKPILLTEANNLPSVTKQIADKSKKQYIIGGTAVVGNAVKNKLSNSTRVSGNDRFSTTKAIIEAFPMGQHQAYVATGQNFADALTGSVVAAKNNAPILLVNKSSMPTPIQSLLNNYATFSIIGGTAVVDTPVVRSLEQVEANNGVVVNFNDDGLKIMVAEAAGIAYEAKQLDEGIELVEMEREITSLDMLKLKKLTFKTPFHFSILDLEGLQYAKNLEILEFPSHVTDFSPISSLTKLETINLHNSFGDQNKEQKIDLTPLSKLKELKTLTTEDIKLENISFLTQLPQLESLSLWNAGLNNLDHLSGLKELRNLDLRGNNISNIKALSTLENLGMLDISFNEVEDISSLRTLTQLEILVINKNIIKDISVVENFPKLSFLAISQNPIDQGMDSIGKATALEHLRIQGTGMTDTSFLASLVNLQTLSIIDEPGVKDIKSLKHLTKLKYLVLANNHIEDLGPLVENVESRSSVATDVHFILYDENLDLFEDSKATQDIERLKQLGVIVNY
jgi:Leucine-rich repeat (LRR) protein